VASGVVVSWVGWVGVGLLAWVAVALVVGVLLGRMFRRRDLQARERPGEVPLPAPRRDGPPPQRRPPARP
jgi:Flp pilus assembly protein TadB